MPETTHVELRNDFAELERLRETIEAWASQHDIGASTARKLNLLLEEHVTNILSYAFSDDTEHAIHIDLSRVPGEGRLCARVRDDGPAYNPLEAAAPDLDAPLEDRPLGGLGIHLIRSLADDVRYAHTGTHNELTIELDLE